LCFTIVTYIIYGITLTLYYEKERKPSLEAE